MKRLARQTIAYGTAVVVVLAVATMYLSPHLMVDLAARFWACF